MKLKILAATFLTLCLATVSVGQEAPGDLVSFKSLKTIPLSQAEATFDLLKVPEGFADSEIEKAKKMLGPARYPVKLSQVVYTTQGVDGKPARASGLVMEPETGRINPVVSYQHGTILQSNVAPSLFDQSMEAHLLYRACAARGYTVLMPDYVGMGVAGPGRQPFLISRCEAAAAADLMSAYEAHKGESISQLFLAGYSQGGHATAATHIRLQREGKRQVTACALMSGPYDIGRELDYLRNAQPAWGAPIAALLFVTLHHYYFPEVPRSEIYRKPFDQLIALFDDPNPSNEDLLRDFHGPSSAMMSDSFTQALTHTTGTYHHLLTENSVLYVAECPTRIYQSANDTLVYPPIAEELFMTMKAGGAPEVELHMLPDAADHHEATLTETVLAALWFDTFLKDE